jgi:integrase
VEPVPLCALSAERTKAARQHAVPLPSLAVDLLRGLPDLGNHVFTTQGNKRVSGLSKAKARVDTLSGVTGWRLHDLRRTMATGPCAAWYPAPRGERDPQPCARGDNAPGLQPLLLRA